MGIDFFRSTYLSYKASSPPLKLYQFSMISLLGPFFSILFFILVRTSNHGIVELDQTILIALLLIPASKCVFYVPFAITRARMLKTFELVLISPKGIFETNLRGLWLVIIETFSITAFVFSALFVCGYFKNFDLASYFTYLFISLSGCMTFAFFGLLLSMMFIFIKDVLIIINSLYFFVIIFSGFIFTPGNNFIFKIIMHLMPAYGTVNALNNWQVGNTSWHFDLILNYLHAFIYLVCAWSALRIAEKQMLKGSL